MFTYSSKEFTERLNSEWETFLLDRRLQYLSDSGVKVVELFADFKFNSLNLERIYEGYHHELYSVDFYNLMISYRNKDTKIEAMEPEFNKNSEEIEWFIEPEVDWLDSSQGELELFSEKTFSNTFDISATEQKVLHQLLEDFDLVSKCIEESKLALDAYHKTIEKQLSGFVAEHIEVTVRDNRGRFIEYKNKLTGEVVRHYINPENLWINDGETIE